MLQVFEILFEIIEKISSVLKIPNGKIIELECDAKKSKLREIEWEVYDELQPGFKD